MKKIAIYLIFVFILSNLIYSIVPDEDKDGVPYEEDECPNSTSVVDQYGCDCSQKTASDCEGKWCCGTSEDPCIKYCDDSGKLAACKIVDTCGSPGYCKDSDGKNYYVKGNVIRVKYEEKRGLITQKYEVSNDYLEAQNCGYPINSPEHLACRAKRWCESKDHITGFQTEWAEDYGGIVFCLGGTEVIPYPVSNNDLEAQNCGGLLNSPEHLACRAKRWCVGDPSNSGKGYVAGFQTEWAEDYGGIVFCIEGAAIIPYPVSNNVLEAQNCGYPLNSPEHLACRAKRWCESKDHITGFQTEWAEDYGGIVFCIDSAYVVSDYCSNEVDVIEYYCTDSDKIGTETYSCPHGCGNGVCIKPGLKGIYSDSKWNFMERVDETINFDWGAGSPDKTISEDNFEVNWAGQVKIGKAGKYTFYTETDDGVRLWIDKVEYFDSPKIDDWNDGGKENKVDLELQEGWHEIKMDYYENKGDASAKLFYSSDEVPRQIIPAQNLRPLDVILKIRTGKDQYKIGEKIHLTGNPAEQDKAGPVEPEKKEPETKGFIVQLKSKPTLEVVNNLITEVKKKETKLEPSSFLYKYSMGLIDRLDVGFKKIITKNKIKKQNNKLNTEHTDASKAIEKALNKKLSNTQNDNAIKVLSMHTTIFNGIALDISLEEALKLKRLSLVKNIYPNYIMHTVLTESVPNIKANEVWGLKDNNNLNIKGNGIKIAIIDTGIDYTHSDLGGCLGQNCKVIGGYDFVNNDNDPMDDQGHGTHCAGIAAANGVVKGVAPEAKLYAYKVLNSMGSGATNDIIAAIERAVDPNQDGNFNDRADVISMSLGGSGDPDDPLSQAVNNAVKNGVVVVASAGNSGPGSNTIGCPACAVYAIAIGASCKPNQENKDCNQGGTPKIAKFSSRGPHRLFNKPDVVAPGVMICASQWEDAFLEGGQQCIDDKHVAISGTSMSAPHVAGVAALLLQKNPELSPLQVKAVLEATATSFGYDTNVEGAGLVNALEAVKLQNSPPIGVITDVKPIGLK